MNVKHKLEMFSETALNEAKERRKIAERQIKAEFDKACAEIEANAIKEAEERLKNEKNVQEQRFGRETITIQTEAKKEFIRLRAELTENVFNAVNKKLEEFRKTSEYDEYMLSGIKAAAEKYGAGIKIILCASDMKHKSRIDSNITVVESECDFFGGFKVLLADSRMTVDNTFETSMNEVRSEFRLNGGLSK